MVAYIVKIRDTGDRIRVLAWSDGEVTNAAGRGFSRVRLSLTAALMAAEESQLFDADELPHLLRAAARLERENKLTPGALRSVAATSINRARKEEARS